MEDGVDIYLFWLSTDWLIIVADPDGKGSRLRAKGTE